MKSTLFYILILIILCTSTSQARNYYLSQNGDDQNTGYSAQASWESIDRLNQQNLMAGDSILFRRGNIFIGEIIVRTSGKNNQPIVYGAFGEGENPVIKGALDIKNWEVSESGIKTAKLANKVYNLYVDDKQQILARYPNQGYLKIDGA